MARWKKHPTRLRKVIHKHPKVELDQYGSPMLATRFVELSGYETDSDAIMDDSLEDLVCEQAETVPLEMIGKWIVWSRDGLRIVGHGDSPTEARESAVVEMGPIEYVPVLRGVPMSKATTEVK